MKRLLWSLALLGLVAAGPAQAEDAMALAKKYACLSCHADLAAAITPGARVGHGAAGSDALDCISCHRYVGHWVR